MLRVSVKILSDVLNAADAGHVTLLALLDLNVAFDTVDHNSLLLRIKHSYSFSKTVLKWVAFSLINRSQTVLFASVKSAPTLLLPGVPQDFVLGLLFFSLYTADIIKIAESFGVQIHCYADDGQLYIYCSQLTLPLQSLGYLPALVLLIIGWSQTSLK